MKYLSTFLLAIMATYGAHAGTNLLDLLKAGKAKYSTYSCQSFIQKADHQTLKSPELLKHVVKLKNFKYLDDYFFHYTNAAILNTTLLSSVSDRAAAQRSIVENKGYSAIIEYQMTYADALSNIQGVGFYIAANPFSSTSYGNTQIALRMSQNANLIDVTLKGTEINFAYTEVTKKIPEFAACNEYLKFSLLMNENGIDAALYSDLSNEWLVLFNEDVIIESKVTPITSKSNTAIIKKLIENGDLPAVVEYIDEIGMANIYKVPLSTIEGMIPAGQKIAGKSTLLTIAGYIKNWNDASKVAFAKIISSKKSAELTALMNEFKTARLISDDVYMKIPLSKASDDFLADITARIKRAPLTAKAWGDFYNENMALLFKKSLVDLPLYLGNFPDATKRVEFYKTYSRQGFTPEQIVSIFDYMFKTDATYFQGLTPTEKNTLFYDYIKHSSADKIPSLVTTMDRLGYNLLDSFHYFVRRPSAFGPNGYTFLSAYIKFKKDPALLTDGLIRTLVSSEEFNSVDFILYLKQTPAFSAAALNFSKSSIQVMKTQFLDRLIKPENTRHFSKEETDLIFGRLLKDDAEGSKLMAKFISVFGYSGSAISASLSSESRTLTTGGHSALIAIKALEADAFEWVKFCDLNNTKGMLQILANTKLAAAKAYLIEKSSDSLLRNPVDLARIPASSLSLILTTAKVRPYFTAYTDEQKLAVALLMKTHQTSDADEFMSTITYSPAMVAQNFTAIVGQRRDDHSDFEQLLNNVSFVSALHPTQFQSLVIKALSFNKPLDLKTLIRSEVLTVDFAIILISKLERSTAATTASEILEHQLNFETISDEDKKLVTQKLVYELPSFTAYSRGLLWKRCFDFAVSMKDTKPLLWQLEKMTKAQRVEYLDYYTSSQMLLREALATMPGGAVKFYETVLENDSTNSVTAILRFIEANYPVPEPYYAFMIKNFGAIRETNELQQSHFSLFTCKNVNKFKAFDAFIDNEPNKDNRKYYKELRKNICQKRD
jgi:hypothetical protein